jgi:hypothetical protein
MKKLLGCIVVVLYAALVAFGQSSTSKDNPPPTEIPTVAFCDLANHVSDYEGKVVRVRVVHSIGFEWNYLYSPDKFCKKTAWVEYDENYEPCPKSKFTEIIDTRLPAWQSYSIVTVVGKIYKCGRSGHMGSHKYKFVLQRTEEATLIRTDKTLPIKVLQ